MPVLRTCLRSRASTLVGQFVNTAIFYIVGLSGVIPTDLLLAGIVAGWLIKTAVEALFTPITCCIINWVKRIEGEDYYDKKTSFNPFN